MNCLNYIFLLDGYIFTNIDDQKEEKINFASIFERFYLNLRKKVWKLMKLMNKGSYGVRFFFSIQVINSQLWLLITWILKKFELRTNPCWRRSRNQTISLISSEQNLCINNSNSHCLEQILCSILIIALYLFRFWVIKSQF